MTKLKARPIEQIQKQFTIPFSLEAVYAAWVSSSTIVPPATKMDIHPVVGGHYRLFIQMPDTTMINEGVFSLVEPNNRIIYTWQWNQDGEETEIDVQFTSVTAGTKLVLTHSGFQKQQSKDDHDSGWDNYVQGLIDFLSSKSIKPA